MVRVYLNSNYSNCPTLHADTILRFLPEKMWTYWWQCPSRSSSFYYRTVQHSWQFKSKRQSITSYPADFNLLLNCDSLYYIESRPDVQQSTIGWTITHTPVLFWMESGPPSPSQPDIFLGTAPHIYQISIHTELIIIFFKFKTFKIAINEFIQIIHKQIVDPMDLYDP